MSRPRTCMWQNRPTPTASWLSTRLADTGWAKRDVMQIVYGNRNWNGPINGVSPSYLTIRDWSLTSGGPFTQTDLDTAARVALIGQTIVGNLFDIVPPLIEEVKKAKAGS